MLKKKFAKGPFTSTLPCFYCNADSDELKYFLLLFIGGLCISSVFLLIGLCLRGSFRDTEKLADQPFKIEQEEKNTKGRPMKNDEKDESEVPHVYVGNHIPIFIKLVWAILIIWIIIYLITYALPDLQVWLKPK